MILPLFRRASAGGTISALYGTIVAQARLPIFYRTYGVPDTVDGRFELLILHLFLLLHRLGTKDADGRELCQHVFDRFCRDMDENLREMGVGDLKVPEEMRRIGEAYYGRAKAYESALGIPDALVRALARNVFASEAELEPAKRLATYAEIAATGLSVQDVAAFKRGILLFPQP